MNYLLSFLILLAVALLIWLAWRHTTLRRRIDVLTHTVHRAAHGEYPPLAIPADERGIEDLSNAIRALAEAQQARIDGLEAERAKLAAVLDQLTDGVLIADEEGRVQFANPAAEEIFGEHLLERSITEVLRHHQLVEIWQKCQTSSKTQADSVELPASRQWLQLVVMPDQHTPGGSLLLVQDLTQLRRLETVRRDFISNLSHELRTPLASLNALTETLQDGALDDPPAARRFIDRIQAEVDALTQMAQELLDLSRIESGQVALDLKSFAPCKLLHASAERMRLQAERAGLVLQVDCPPDLPNVRADEPRIEQVLVNLIHNAVKFTRPGGSVTLLAEAGEGLVRFAVRDTGIGIPAEDLPRVFERFYKIDRARSSGGTGLGLSIARHLVESHGGKIWVESLEGQGSTFWFSLPSPGR
jgi:two-component system phosphate regulon sensor histidine kinase PhoR